MKKTIGFLLLFTILYTIQVRSQQQEIDSLRKVYAKLQKRNSQQADTSFINLINELAYKYHRINPDSTLFFALQAKELSDRVDFNSGSAEALRCIGLYNWVKSNYPDALKYFRQSLTIAEKFNLKKVQARSANNIAIIYTEQGNYPEAQDMHYKALQIREEIKDIPGVAMSYSNLGNIFIYQGMYKDAIEMHTKAIKIREELGDKIGISINQISLALIYFEQGNYPEALEMNLKSLKTKEEIGDKQSMAVVLNNIALIYENQKKFQDALEMHFKALKIREEIGDKQGISSSMTNISSIYFRQGKIDEALDMNNKSLAIKQEIGDKNGIASTLLGIGNIYLEKKSFQIALEYLHKADKLNIELGNVTLDGNIKNSLAKCYLEINDFQQALRYAKKGLQISLSAGTPNEIMDVSSTLSEIYEKLGNGMEALKYHKLFKTYSDSLISIEKEKKTQLLQADYEYQKKESQLLAEQQRKEFEHDKQLARQRFYTLLFVAAFGMVLVVVFFIYRNQQKQKKSKLLLQTKNNEIRNKNIRLNQQKEELEEAHRNIKASINYASLIQNAIMPTTEILEQSLKDYFIVYKPRDIVSGDFYWFKQIKNIVYIAAADCTGHGVPGAFMSMMGVSLLNEIVSKRDVNPPNMILNELRKRLKKSLHQTSEKHQTQDGMDIAFVLIDLDNKMLQYSGANNPLYLFRKNPNDSNVDFIEYKADRMPIGVHPNDIYDFQIQEFQLMPNDSIYIFSDGYSSQFGGPNYHKLKSKKFQEILLSIQDLTMVEQKKYLEKFLNDWQGKNEQVDDILVIGIRI